MTAPKPKPHGLIFRESSHRYTLDGDSVPGVTTIIGVLDKPALPKWAAGMVAEFVADNEEDIAALRRMGRNPMVSALKGMPWQKRDDAGARGTTFHDFAERIARGEDVEVPPEQVGMVEAALQFMEDWHVEPVLIEAAVASREYKWAGKLDLIADCEAPNEAGSTATPFKGRAIFDWKSGKRIYTSACFQLNAYAHAEFYGENGDEHPLADLGIEAAYGVHIRDDGYDVYPLEFGPHVYDEFLCIRRTFGINKRAEGNWKIPGTGYVGAPYIKEDVA